MGENSFERASRRNERERPRARPRERPRARPEYENVVVVYGATTFREASVRAGITRLRDADLVIGTTPGRQKDASIPFGETVGVILKDRYGREGKQVRESDPCPCRGGRVFGLCHGR